MYSNPNKHNMFQISAAALGAYIFLNTSTFPSPKMVWLFIELKSVCTFVCTR